LSSGHRLLKNAFIRLLPSFPHHPDWRTIGETMRILAALQGPYGQRIVNNIRKHLPIGWTLATFTLPSTLPPIVDDPTELLPHRLDSIDLLLALSESTRSAQLIPAMAELAKARGVIIPIDNSAWLPSGLRNQLEKELADLGIASAFPKTFCTLTERSYGYRDFAREYQSEVIFGFAQHFGRPKLEIGIDHKRGIIVAARVLRGAPCGSTFHVARWLAGIAIDEAIPRAGLTCHHFPCLASMQQEEINEGEFNTLMHISGYLINEEVERQIVRAQSGTARGTPLSPGYDCCIPKPRPSGNGDLSFLS